MEIYSLDSRDSRESPEKQKKSDSKILPQAGLDLRTSDFPVLPSKYSCTSSPCAVSHRDLNDNVVMLYKFLDSEVLVGVKRAWI